MSVQISCITFEHHRTPLGIAEDKPRISWRFSGDAKEWHQKSYELGVRRGSNTEELYSINSPESVLVPWPSKALASGESAVVRVRALGLSKTKELSTEWSPSETVEAGLLSTADWKCDLIEATATINPDKAKQPVLFRRTFTAKSKVVKARLYATAHGLYELQINGQRVGDQVLAPGWTNYEHRLPYQVYDVTALLAEGESVLAAEVGEGWYAGRLGFSGGRRNIYGTSLGLICQMIITYEDSSVSVIGSDKSWRASTGAIISSEIYDGETYDARLFQSGWSSPGFDDSKWTEVKTSPLDKVLSTLLSPEAPPVRRIERLPAISVFRSPSGKVIVDFGQNLVGWLEVKVKGPAGHVISLQHTEVLENNECATRPLRAALCRDTLILSGKDMIWEPKFTFHGFRYVGIENWPTTSGLPNMNDLTAVVLHTDMEKTGWFECSDSLLNRLHKNVIWGMKGNFLSVPTDCPQRDERLGWTGDIQAFGSTASFLYDSSGMLHDWLKGLAMEQLENGGTVPPLVSPNILGSGGIKPNAIWGDAVVSCPWDLYQATGDLEILKSQYESMQKWMDQGVPRDERGLWDKEIGSQLGDWLDPAAPPDEPGNGRTDHFLVANAFLIGMTDLIAEIAARLGESDDNHRYATAAAALRKHFADEYITSNGRVVSDSQTALALCIRFSLFSSPAQQQAAASRLEHIILSKARFKIATGFAGTPILGHALTKVGKSQLFYRMLLHKKNPSWLYSVTMGATTIWERWDSMLPDGSINPGEMTSFNHYALGSVADWMHRVMGGLSALEPGWKKILVKPVPGGSITWVKTSYLSPYGLIAVDWKIEGSKFLMEVTIPPNTTAMVYLPGTDRGEVLGSGTYSLEAAYQKPEWPPLPIYPPFYPHDDDEP